jgi:hypothetical protein
VSESGQTPAFQSVGFAVLRFLYLLPLSTQDR